MSEEYGWNAIDTCFSASFHWLLSSIKEGTWNEMHFNTLTWKSVRLPRCTGFLMVNNGLNLALWFFFLTYLYTDSKKLGFSWSFWTHLACVIQDVGHMHVSASREMPILNSERLMTDNWFCSRQHWNCHFGNGAWSVLISLSKCQGHGGYCIKMNKPKFVWKVARRSQPFLGITEPGHFYNLYTLWGYFISAGYKGVSGPVDNVFRQSFLYDDFVIFFFLKFYFTFVNLVRW